MNRRTSRGFATLLVLWVAAIASVIMVTVEAISATQAVAGREALARVRAAWAARAGLEFALARAEFDSLNPSTSSVFALFDDLAASGEGRLQDSAWRLSYTDQDGDRLGVRDAHEKINLNIATAAQLALLPEMPEDGPDSVADWIDADDDTRALGAERSFYQSRLYGYKPRNGPFKSIAELELVVGMSAEVVRGEDWNLNGRLDPNEDDGDLSWPPDNADGRLDAGLSAYLTVASVDGGLGVSGESRLDLATATSAQVVQRLGVDAVQAQVIAGYGASSGATITTFISRTLRQLATTAGLDQAAAAAVRNLDREQLGTLLNECVIGDASGGKPGKLNINTCDAEVLEYIPEITPTLADAIIFERSGRPDGFRSVADLLDVPTMNNQRLARVAQYLDVRSNAIIVSSRGRDSKTGIEVEIVATVDRSTIPAVITELRTQ